MGALKAGLLERGLLPVHRRTTASTSCRRASSPTTRSPRRWPRYDEVLDALRELERVGAMTDIINHWIDGQTTTAWRTSTRTHRRSTTRRSGTVARRRCGSAARPTSTRPSPPLSPAFGRVGRLTSIAKRQSVLFAFRELLNARKGELAEILTAEHGKVLSDALGEIARGLEVVEFACGIAHLTKGEYSENVSTGVDVYSLRQPLGVVGIISPFNFPAMVPMWFFPIAIAAGNTVVLKPSEKDPSAAIWMAELLQGGRAARRRASTSCTATRRPSTRCSSTPTCSRSRSSARPRSRATSTRRRPRHGKRVQALGGAKNHMLVLPDADLDLVADSAVNAGLRLGRRALHGDLGRARGRHRSPTSWSRRSRSGWPALTHRRRPPRLRHGTAHHRGAPRQGRVATSTSPSTDGATVVVDGRDVEPDGDADGFWLGPTLIDNVPTTSRGLHRRDLRPGALGRARRRLRRGPRHHQREPLRQRHRDLHERRRRRAAVPARGAGRHDRHQRADPGAGRRTTRSAAGRTRCSATPRRTARTASTSSPARRRSPRRWLDPSHGGINLGFPRNA